MAIFGYARVSTTNQDLTLQIQALESFGCDKIFSEKITGTKTERPQLKELLNQLRQGDLVVVWKLDRLARSTKQLIELVEKFNKEGIRLISTTQSIDTETSLGRMFVSLLSMISEFEYNIRAERCREGMRVARERGIKGGRPKIITPEIIKKIEALIKSGMNLVEISKALEINVNTIRYHVRFNEVKYKKNN